MKTCDLPKLSVLCALKRLIGLQWENFGHASIVIAKNVWSNTLNNNSMSSNSSIAQKINAEGESIRKVPWCKVWLLVRNRNTKWSSSGRLSRAMKIGYSVPMKIVRKESLLLKSITTLWVGAKNARRNFA